MGEGRAKNVVSPFHQMAVWGEVVNLNTSGKKNEDFEKNILVSAKSHKYHPYVSTMLSDKHFGYIFKK